jgi:hypothetical protein
VGRYVGTGPTVVRELSGLHSEWTLVDVLGGNMLDNALLVAPSIVITFSIVQRGFVPMQLVWRATEEINFERRSDKRRSVTPATGACGNIPADEDDCLMIQPSKVVVM